MNLSTAQLAAAAPQAMAPAGCLLVQLHDICSVHEKLRPLCVPLQQLATCADVCAGAHLMRFLGLNCSRRISRSHASLDACGKRSWMRLACIVLHDSIMVAAKGDWMDSRSSADGLPVSSMMRSSWFIVEEPGKMGLPVSSSPRMQPAWQAAHQHGEAFSNGLRQAAQHGVISTISLQQHTCSLPQCGAGSAACVNRIISLLQHRCCCHPNPAPVLRAHAMPF
jgi:hypothetical protein